MPAVVRWYVKSALLYLVFALGLDVVRLWGAARWAARSVSWHLFAVGWLTQLIFGIALWMLPSYTREQPRRNESVNWGVLALLNAGLLLRAVAETLLATHALWGWALALAGVLQWLAALGFVFNTWARVRGPRRRRAGG